MDGGEANLKHRNIRIRQDQITDKIRVSTAAIWREEIFCDGPHEYWLVETWCFSDDPRQRSFQVIHGTPTHLHNEIRWIAMKTHDYIVKNLRGKYDNPTK